MLWRFIDYRNGYFQFYNTRTRVIFNRTEYTWELADSLVRYLNQR